MERELVDKQLDKEYAGIMGNLKFRNVATELVLGAESRIVKDGLVGGAS